MCSHLEIDLCQNMLCYAVSMIKDSLKQEEQQEATNGPSDKAFL